MLDLVIENYISGRDFIYRPHNSINKLKWLYMCSLIRMLKHVYIYIYIYIYIKSGKVACYLMLGGDLEYVA